ncbi:MAG TPA: PfkB family carbohydrate kinase [Candidatus Paceibacterota bacterium]|nr:PfkB family carbohydrate kinase [Verrucomicrobiota bacterium]HRY48558.1 PfkB family carbohydrate kinase [Candidatus Paceibacterota bacterium]
MSIKPASANRPRVGSIGVLGLGCTAVDDVLYVASFPASDEKMRVERSARRCGGLTGVALVTAARLGACCEYGGCLGNDEYSRCITEDFQREGVGITHAARLNEARVVHSVIVVGQDTASRNIFYEASGLIGAHDSLPAEEVILASKVLFIDQYGMQGNLRAARVARDAGVPVIADFEDADVPLFAEVLDCVDHLVLSEDFARKLTGAASAAGAAMELWSEKRSAVVITSGGQGCWTVSADAPSRARHHPAFPVKAVDTTGCGDVFHGAYAARLARGEILSGRIRFASAAAALKASTATIPTLATVEEFLRTR